MFLSIDLSNDKVSFAVYYTCFNYLPNCKICLAYIISKRPGQAGGLLLFDVWFLDYPWPRWLWSVRLSFLPHVTCNGLYLRAMNLPWMTRMSRNGYLLLFGKCDLNRDCDHQELPKARVDLQCFHSSVGCRGWCFESGNRIERR